MTLSLSGDDVRLAADMDGLVTAIEDVLREEHNGLVIMPPRVNITRDGTFLRMMPAYLSGSGLLGYKSFHGSMTKGVRYLIVLCQESDGAILATVDGAYLTAARTGATSGVATRYLARPGPASVGLIGSGLEAETNLAAVAAVREITGVRVYSRSVERRAAFAARAAESLQVDVTPVDSPEAAVCGSDVVVIATNTGAHGPVAFRGDWLEEGQHVVSIGSTSPFLREVDAETFERADRVVFDAGADQIFEESGDLMAVSTCLRDRLRECVSLPSIVGAGGIARPDSAITFFKSVGTAAQDVAAAKAVYDVALERGLGNDLGELAVPKTF